VAARKRRVEHRKRFVAWGAPHGTRYVRHAWG
jgi:hypothetical protein